MNPGIDEEMRRSCVRTIFPKAMKPMILKHHPRLSAFIRGLFLVLACSAQAAGVTVTDAWVRGTVPAQRTTGAFATLTSTADAKLVAVKTPVAKSVEIHRSEMRGGVMRMEAVDAVPLPAGKAVKLEEGGFHVMLMGIAAPIQAGSRVPLEFVVEDAKGKRSTVSTLAPVRPLGQ
jgi:periplasmic copper chaperone A